MSKNNMSTYEEKLLKFPGVAQRMDSAARAIDRGETVIKVRRT